jgi:tRNA(Ile)-lysidine synthase
VRDLADRLLKTIRKQELIRAGDRLAVAVSGGADSIALLFLLLELKGELGIVLSVAHVNHKLRGQESDEDERFVAQLAAQRGLEFFVCEASVPASVDAIGAGVEAAGRELRYGFFRRLAREGRVTKIATAHTLDDQAETVLLRIFRGTGIRGLAGIHPRLVFEEKDIEEKGVKEKGRPASEVVRPLLGFRRSELREFLREEGLRWREDASNLDTAFLRNRVRHRLLPLIKDEFSESAIEHLAELAEIARAEAAEELWRDAHLEVDSLVRVERLADPQDSATDRSRRSIEIAPLLALALAAQRRVIVGMVAMEPAGSVSFRLVGEILELLRAEPGTIVDLPCGYRVKRTRDRLCLELSDKEEDQYEYALHIPGEVEVPELGIRVRATIVDPQEFVSKDMTSNGMARADCDSLLDPQRLSGMVLVRNWRAGDRYWPGHTKQEKKVKELLSDRHATGTEKKLWPVAVGRGDLVWMRGFAVPASVRAPDGATKAIWIRELRA